MEFTEKQTQKYNGISEQDLKDFENRKIIFNSTGSSCLGSENAVLTLTNEVLFYTEKNKFFERLKGSRINDYPEDRKQHFFYKWIQQFLSDNQTINKAVNYIYSKTLINELKEASILIYNEQTDETV